MHSLFAVLHLAVQVPWLPEWEGRINREDCRRNLGRNLLGFFSPFWAYPNRSISLNPIWWIWKLALKNRANSSDLNGDLLNTIGLMSVQEATLLPLPT